MAKVVGQVGQGYLTFGCGGWGRGFRPERVRRRERWRLRQRLPVWWEGGEGGRGVRDKEEGRVGRVGTGGRDGLRGLLGLRVVGTGKLVRVRVFCLP